MPAIPPGSKVLVTGSNGFFGSWISKHLLERGFFVRGTVRSAAKGELIKDILKSPNFEYIVVADITQAGAFDDAVKEVDGIVHTAAPLILPEGDPNLVILPAVKGTQTLLKSVRNHGNRVKRVVTTSSITALSDFSRRAFYKYSAADWNEACLKEVNEKGKDAAPLAKYSAAKTLGERAVWEFFEEHRASFFDFATIVAPLTWGPVLTPMHIPTDMSPSQLYLWNYLKNPSSDPSTYTTYTAHVADVRDVAALYAEALVRPEAKRRRILFGPHAAYPQFAYDVVNGSEALKAKGVTAPVGVPGAANGLAPPMAYDDQLARKTLGITPRPLEETIIDATSAFADAGLLP
ncbi:methylglyoxal reductase (NADPH-dependent) gre2 [Tulasnella sp. 427]|nr:methylglyoxal reductase (NADPH-dependent) gre2 [Tulasnella sp. 427]